MSSKLNRRAFLGGSVGASVGMSLIAGSTSTMASPLLDFLTSDAAESEVFHILQEHLQINHRDRHLVKPFLQRLRTPGLHTEVPAVFDAWLARQEGYEQNLAAYVIEEFVVGSNYLAVRDGAEKKLKIL